MQQITSMKVAIIKILQTFQLIDIRTVGGKASHVNENEIF